MQLILLASIHISMIFILTYFLISDGFLEFILLTMGTYDLHLRIDKINEKVISFIETKNFKQRAMFAKVSRYIVEHNSLCNRVKNSSQFWHNIYLALVLTITPSSLILLHLAIFEKVDPFLRIAFIGSLISCYFFLVVLQYFFSSLSHKMHRLCNHLSRIQWRFIQTNINNINNNYNLRLKLKLQTYFERLSSDRRIGFSIGSLTVITYPLFANVSRESLPH